MHAMYREILQAMGEPRWWGEHGVPRYCDFKPQEADNIYADQVLLLRVECQGCGHPFDVAMSTTYSSKETLADYVRKTVIEEEVVELMGGPMRRYLMYGDPPNIGCCGAGPTMTSVPQRILEFWRNDAGNREWRRDPDLEIEARPDWADDDPDY